MAFLIFMSRQYLIRVATKQDKKAIQRFYKSQNYNANFMGNDLCWLMTSEEHIIGVVIISLLAPDTPYFLHGLVTSNKHHNQGIASALISAAVHEVDNIICFANEELAGFYLKKQFTEIEPKLLSEELYGRYYTYQKKNKNLKAFAINQHQLTML